MKYFFLAVILFVGVGCAKSPCDFDRNGVVDESDLDTLNEFIGSDSELHDVDGDGIVAMSDLLICRKLVR